MVQLVLFAIGIHDYVAGNLPVGQQAQTLLRELAEGFDCAIFSFDPNPPITN